MSGADVLKESNDRRSEEVAPETKSRSRPAFLSRKNAVYVHFFLFLVKLRVPRPPYVFRRRGRLVATAIEKFPRTARYAWGVGFRSLPFDPRLAPSSRSRGRGVLPNAGLGDWGRGRGGESSPRGPEFRPVSDGYRRSLRQGLGDRNRPILAGSTRNSRDCGPV